MHYKTREKYPHRLIAALCFLLAGTLFFAYTPLAAYAAPGQLDPTFSSDGKLTDWPGSERATGVAIQPDGKIIIVGSNPFAPGDHDFRIARYNSDGTPDTTFGSGTGRVTTDFGADDDANNIIIQPDGKILVGGVSASVDQGGMAVARYNPDGTLDTSFGGGSGKVHTLLPCWYSPYGRVGDIAIQSNGRIVGTVGMGSDDNCQNHGLIVRYHSNGSLDTSFGIMGTVSTAHPLLFAGIDPLNGTIWAGTLGEFGYDRIVPFTSNGSPLPGNAAIVPSQYYISGHSVAFDSEGKMVLAGYNTEASGYAFALFRFNANGSPDTSFGSDGTVTTPMGFGDSFGSSVVVQTDGKIVAAGTNRPSPTTGSDFALARYNLDGTLDATFGGGDGITTVDFDNSSNDGAYDVALDNQGRAVVAGGSNGMFALARFLLAPAAVTITVTNTNDSGAGSLRQTIADAAPGDTINFSGSISGSTITLTSGELGIDKDLTIQGPGAHLLSISGNNASRVFNIYQGTVTLDGITIRDGTAGEGLTGGGINNSQTGRLTVSNCAVSNNTATYGGGIANSGILTVTNSASSGNIAGYLGGGILNSGTLTVTTSAVSGNNVIEGGGIFGGAGIYNGSATLTLVQSTVSGNIGSGIENVGVCDDSFECYNATAIITNSTVSTNTGVGITNSAICFFGQCPNVLANLVNSTIFGNAGGGIGALGVPGSTLLNNTIVAGNSGFDIGGFIGAASHSLIGDAASSGGIVNGVNGNIVGANPLLGPLQNNGRPTLTHALLTDSPAINAGNNCVLIVNGCGNGNPALPTDQRGRARKGTVDIGSFEFGSRPHFDFDGDGRADVSVFRSSDRVWYLNQSTDGFNAVQFGLSTDKIAPGDYDGDGKADISVYRDGTWYWLNSSTNRLGSFQFGLASDIPQPADYTGDGRAELAVYRNGTWWMLDLANGQVSAVQYGLASDKPVHADYDGDGRIDQAVYRGNGEWYLNRSAQGPAYVNFGLATDKPVPGDYDGDGRTDVAVFRPSDGNWYIRRSSDDVVTATNWGLATDIPVPGDYDGDGRADVAVYRDGIWYVIQSSNGSVSAQHFGLGSDIPVASVNIQ